MAARALPDDLPPDGELLAHFAACDTDPIDLAAELNIRLDLLLDWLAAPETTKRLNALLSARAVNRQQQQQALQDESLAELVDLQKLAKKSDADDAHIERRRLATTILRFTARSGGPLRLFGAMAPAANARAGASGGLSLSRFPAHYQTRSRHIRTVPILHEAPAILSPPDKPDPALSPAAVTTKLLHRLQDSDNPMPGDGLRTLFNHFTQDQRDEVDADTAEDFARTDLDAFHKLLGHHSAILHRTLLPPDLDKETRPLSATQRADLIDLDGQRWQLTLEFTRESPEAPWLIDELHLDVPPPPDPAPCPCPDCVEAPHPPQPPSPPPPPQPDDKPG
jgi:hypothetical protein